MHELRPRSYLLLVLAVACLAMLATSFVYVFGRGIGCDDTGYRDDTFMAYCRVAGYEDYEHGAFWYGWEPKALANLRKADVVFLGNSRMQFAFSTQATKAYFDSTGVSYYLLGFGDGEVSEFLLRFMRRQGVKPKVLVINADPFFDRHLRASAYQVVRGGLGARIKYTFRRWMQSWHVGICRMAGPPLCTDVTAIYRSVDHGEWSNLDRLEAKAHQSVPIDGATPAPIDTGQARIVAEDFLDAIGISRDCVVLTGVPNPAADAPASAADLAAVLGVARIQPILSGLVTLDGSHLDKASAERYSQAVLPALAPVIQRCAK